MSDEALDMLAERTKNRRASNDDLSGDEALEVIFEAGAPARRRSSLVNNMSSQRPGVKREPTACYVHRGLDEKPGDGETKQSTEGMSSEKPTDKANGTPPNHGDRTQSRLLTKKQLSDMAFGMRELSKRLGHLKLMLKVKNVFILVKAYDESLVPKAVEMSKWLLDAGYVVWVEDNFSKEDIALILEDADESRKSRLQFWNKELCTKRPSTFDIVISLGGDGTVLYASYLFQRIVPPVISFALGSLGFLTKFDFNNFQTTLPKAFKDGVTLSLRLRFEGTVMRSNRREGHTDKEHKKRNLTEELIGNEADDNHTHHPANSVNILNEIVLDRGPSATMSSIELFGDEEWFTTVQADGICISTPTGSTAYNLAAGGSLCHPDNPVILVTAIAPHTLNFRPIILPDTMVLRVGVPYDARVGSWVSFDGKERAELFPGDYVTISASRYPYPTVMPLERKSEDWVDSISRTLQWNSREKQKAFTKAPAEKEKEEEK